MMLSPAGRQIVKRRFNPTITTTPLINRRHFSSKKPPADVDVAIIGGGVTGASLFYHLEKLGMKSAMFEKNELTSGATWHAAGLVTYFHGGNNFRLWHNYSVNLFKEWQKDGTIHSFHTPGSMRLIEKGNRDRLDEGRHHEGKAELYAQLFDCEPMHLIGPDEIKKHHPLVDTTNIDCALWTEGDGHIDPSAVTNAFINKAKSDLGANNIFRDCPVVATRQRSDGKWEVDVEPQGSGDKHTVVAQHVINAAGLWCREVGQQAGIHIPAVVLQHQYVITEDIPALAELHKARGGKQLPVLRDMKGSCYIRDERDGILIGPYEQESDVIVTDPISKEASYFLYEGALDRLFEHIEHAASVIPEIGESGLKTVLNGPTCWPADGSHLVGPSFQKKGYWLACAESYGIAHSGGLGHYLAHYIANGEPPYELNETDPCRYGEWATQDFVTTKVKETYGWNNHVHYPNENAPAARPHKPQSQQLYDAMKERGCQFGFSNGWEAPAFFNTSGKDEGQTYNSVASFRRPWCNLEGVKQEVDGLMNHCGVLHWPFAKYTIKGKDSEKFLDRLVANDLPSGDKVQLLHALTPTGKVLSEITCINVEPDHYYLVSYPSMEKFDERMFMENKKEGEDVEFSIESENRDVLMVNGPESVNILKEQNEVFGEKWGLFKWKKVSLFGHDDVYALKVSFIGELGFELHTPSGDVGCDIYKKLVGLDSKIVDWGGAAMNSLRLEKGIPLFGSDFTKDHSALEVGLYPKFIKLDKSTDFVGKEALKAELPKYEAGEMRDLVMFQVDLSKGEDMGRSFADTNNAREKDTDIADVVGNEPIFDNGTGKCVGFTTSGAYGFATGKSVGMGYVPTPLAKEGAADLSVDLLGRRYPLIVKDTAAMLSWGPRQRALKKAAAA